MDVSITACSHVTYRPPDEDEDEAKDEAKHVPTMLHCTGGVPRWTTDRSQWFERSLHWRCLNDFMQHLVRFANSVAGGCSEKRNLMRAQHMAIRSSQQSLAALGLVGPVSMIGEAFIAGQTALNDAVLRKLPFHQLVSAHTSGAGELTTPVCVMLFDDFRRYYLQFLAFCGLTDMVYSHDEVPLSPSALEEWKAQFAAATELQAAAEGAEPDSDESKAAAAALEDVLPIRKTTIEDLQTESDTFTDPTFLHEHFHVRMYRLLAYVCHLGRNDGCVLFQ